MVTIDLQVWLLAVGLRAGEGSSRGGEPTEISLRAEVEAAMHVQKLRACHFSELSTGTIAAYLKEDLLFFGIMVEVENHKWFLELKELKDDASNYNMWESVDVNAFPFLSFSGAKILPRLEADKFKVNKGIGNYIILIEDLILFQGGTRQKSWTFNVATGKPRDIKTADKLYCYSWDIVAPDLNSKMVSIKQV